jgi:hypothetical protein
VSFTVKHRLSAFLVIKVTTRFCRFLFVRVGQTYVHITSASWNFGLNSVFSRE